MNIEKITATIAAATFTLTIYADGGETVATQAYRDLRWHDRDTLFTGEIIEKLAPDSGFSPFVVWTGEGWAEMSARTFRATTVSITPILSTLSHFGTSLATTTK